MISPGAKVFYSDNHEIPSPYSPVAFRLIEEARLTPAIYAGAARYVRDTSVDREIRADFYQSKIVVLLFGRGEGWRPLDDTWAGPEIAHALSLGIKMLVYLTGDVTVEEFERLGFRVAPRLVDGPEAFGVALREDLAALLAESE